MKHGELGTDFASLKRTVALERPSLDSRRHEWIAAFRAEEVLIVVCTCSHLLVVESDIRRIYNNCVAVIASRREFLLKNN